MASSAGVRLISAIRSTFRKLNALADAMDRTPYNDLADSVSHLEREVTRLNEEPASASQRWTFLRAADRARR
jgi:hypothetical protein